MRPRQLTGEVICRLFIRAKVDVETANVRVDQTETGHLLRGTGQSVILRGRIGAVYLCLISLGRRKTGAGEGLESGIWRIFRFGGYDGRCDGCTDDGGCAGMEGGWGECTGTMWAGVGVRVVRRQVGLRCGRLGVGGMGVVGGGLGTEGGRVGGAPVDGLRVIVLVHWRGVVRRTGGLAIERGRRCLVVRCGRPAKDGLVCLVALVWLAWASWPLHRGWR